MISCPECSKHVSDSALACPNCGFGIAAAQDDERQIDKQQSENKSKKRIKFGCLSIFVLITINGLIGTFCGTSVNTLSRPENQAAVPNIEYSKSQNKKIEEYQKTKIDMFESYRGVDNRKALKYLDELPDNHEIVLEHRDVLLVSLIKNEFKAEKYDDVIELGVRLEQTKSIGDVEAILRESHAAKQKQTNNNVINKMKEWLETKPPCDGYNVVYINELYLNSFEIDEVGKQSAPYKNVARKLNRCLKKIKSSLPNFVCKREGAIRESLKSTLDSEFLNTGMDVQVKVYGRCNRKISLKWIWNRVSIMRANENMSVETRLEHAGFENLKWDAYTRFWTNKWPSRDRALVKKSKNGLDYTF